MAHLVALVVNSPLANAGDKRDAGLVPGSEDHWGRIWQPTPVFLPGESHGQRSLVGYSPWGHTELEFRLLRQLTTHSFQT